MAYYLATIFLFLGVFCWASFYYKSYIFGRMPWRVATTKKVIALTFDDGPNEPFTTKIAGIIESHGGRATFFVVGKNCERFPGVITELHKRGHAIGAHSYRHAFHRYFVDPLYSQEIIRTKDILQSQGVSTVLFRFPWLFRTPWLLKSVKRFGYDTPLSGQFAHPLEPFQVDAKRIIKHTSKIARPGAIIIFHDGYNAKPANRDQTVAAVAAVTKKLAAEGYRFVTVPELLAIGRKHS